MATIETIHAAPQLGLLYSKPTVLRLHRHFNRNRRTR